MSHLRNDISPDCHRPLFRGVSRLAFVSSKAPWLRERARSVDALENVAPAFRTKLRGTIETAARVILIQADRADVPVPRQPPERSSQREDSNGEAPTQQEMLGHAEETTEQVSEIIHPAFSLDPGKGCEIHQNTFLELQTYLGLHEDLAVNEGARSFLYDSNRERTPLGYNHRAHLRDLSIGEIREMYRESVG